MRFSIDHRFDAPVADVERVTLDPAFQDALSGLPNVAERRILESQTTEAGVIRRRTRYRLKAELPAVVVRTIGTSQIGWDEVARYEPSARTWHVDIKPHVFESGFDGRATVVLRDAGTATVRSVTGEIKVRVPLVGSRAERAIVDGLRENLDAEARVLTEHLTKDRQNR